MSYPLPHHRGRAAVAHDTPGTLLRRGSSETFELAKKKFGETLKNSAIFFNLCGLGMFFPRLQSRIVRSGSPIFSEKFGTDKLLSLSNLLNFSPNSFRFSVDMIVVSSY